MKEILFKVLPDRFLVNMKKKREVKHLQQKANDFTANEEKVIQYLGENEYDNLVLFTGFQKSGNTWVRFLIYNYFNILNNHVNHTLTYNELNRLQNNNLEAGDCKPFTGGFPNFYRTHLHYKRSFDYFDKLIFLYRNPLDTLISKYYFSVQREQKRLGRHDFEKRVLKNIDDYVRFNLYHWIFHFNSLIDRTDIVLNYEDLKKDTGKHLVRVIEGMGYQADSTAIRRSVEMSDFENIKRMGRQKGQTSGNASASKYQGEFARKGQSRQYHSELKPATISKAQKMLHEHQIQIDL